MAATTPRAAGWDDFRLVAAVATARTLPAAALLLGLDHSTVFRRLRQIEARLGTPLFERGPGGYAPTAAGTEIAALATRVDADVNAVLRKIAGQSPSPAGEVRIATSDALLFDLVLPVLADFLAACPDIRLDLVTGNTPLNLSRRDADVAIRATHTPQDTLVGRKVGRIAWAAYGPAPSSPPTPAPQAASPAALFASPGPWVGFGDGLSGLAAASWFAGQVPDHRITCRFDTVSGLAAGIQAGLGCGLLPCFVGDSRPALARLLPPLAQAATDLWLLTHPDLQRLPRIRVLLDFLGVRLTRLRPRLEG